ncbi:Fe(3+)-hydroxamate ABC transporter permease FhuB [Aureimonas sp. ME7]|uniref:Fe(3+)-hydroxamate ABC transporter permease FhuB n=1 Tax=Aureimonas sp. ME7 TaxID=2744252 RepID=UPI0015F59402|nr:Fe(3+)-hydroxamate ABC transporter permease FhuB [Aureimonas sp. ME7]
MIGTRRSGFLPARHVFALLVLAATLFLAWRGLDALLPTARWLQAVQAPDPADPQTLVFLQSAMPRLAMSLLAGAALGLAGSVFQHLFSNPLADPSLLGAASGAQLALTLALLYAPGALAFGPEPVAWAGAALALGLVFASAFRQGFSPSGLVLAGLVINLYLGALASLLVLFNHDFLSELFLWQAGSLAQSGWSGPFAVASRLLPFAVLMALLRRPLRLLELGDASSRALGLGVGWTRGLLLAGATLLVASVIGSTGLIGFVGLAAPHISRALRAGRRAFDPWGAAITGAILLAFVDQVTRELSAFAGEIPTGSVVAVMGGPLLLALLSRMPRSPAPPPLPTSTYPRPAYAGALGWLALALLLVTALSLSAARMRGGWSFDPWALEGLILQGRALRIAAAAGAGAGLALSGFLLQRITGNPLASPELLGVSQGAGLGLVLAMLLVPGAGTGAMLLFTSAGGLAALLLVLGASRRGAREPNLPLLAGVAVGGIASGVTSFFLASGDPRVAILLSWFSGSIGRVQGASGSALVCIVLLGLGLSAAMHRNLDTLLIGRDAARPIGFPHGAVSFAGLALAAVLTAAATITVGPLSFVGLMAPHLVRRAGFRTAGQAVPAAALAGAILLVAADWIGRNIAYPWPISAGLLVTFLAGPLILAGKLGRNR